ERQVFHQQSELVRILRLRGQADELDLVAGECVDGAARQQSDPFAAVGDRRYLRADKMRLHRFGQALLGRGALDDRDLLAPEIGEAVDRRVGRDQKSAAVDEDQIREVDVLQARQRYRRV